jgi:uncharacterized protein (DUF2384 family)
VESDEKFSVCSVGEYSRKEASVYQLAFQFFNDDSKTRLWLRTPNPMLGNISPCDMMRLGRHDKLLRFMTQAIEEGRPRRL